MGGGGGVEFHRVNGKHAAEVGHFGLHFLDLICSLFSTFTRVRLVFTMGTIFVHLMAVRTPEGMAEWLSSDPPRKSSEPTARWCVRTEPACEVS